jgi:pseudouridine-5'-phosphate glycosidase
MKEYLNINPEVNDALKEGKPVVALESTIISHGMPYPKNVETALNVEKIIRDRGAVPATIAILKGVLKVGLTEEEIEYLGKAKDVIKTSRRDIPFIVSKKLDGATTVASTMLIASLAGIKVFATGGIGGVHRGASESFDISADLEELSKTDVAVVCAGAKSILDIGLTLEYLETHGVPVVGYKTGEMPAFYTRKSGYKVDYRVVDYKIFESIVNNRYRMTYDQVTEILENTNEELTDKYKDIVPMLKTMEELSMILRKKRELRGAIDFEFPERKVISDETGKAIDVRKYERKISNKIIEEFMLVCNETVAEHYYWLNMPFVYRVHEDPDEEKMYEFSKFIHNFGYSLKGNVVHPKELQQLLNKIKDKREESIINNMMLRSLKKAIYSPDASTHFGLAAEYYCHFTSPIRRYPDLQIHRIIKGHIKGKYSEDGLQKLYERTALAAEQSSKMERLADEVERDTEKIRIAEFMSDKIGQEYEGVVSGVTNFGVFVELENTVEGLVHISNMVDDYYIYDDEKKELFGQGSHKTYKIGDRVKVRVDNVSIPKAEIDFALI